MAGVYNSLEKVQKKCLLSNISPSPPNTCICLCTQRDDTQSWQAIIKPVNPIIESACLATPRESHLRYCFTQSIRWRCKGHVNLIILPWQKCLNVKLRFRTTGMWKKAHVSLDHGFPSNTDPPVKCQTSHVANVCKNTKILRREKHCGFPVSTEWKLKVTSDQQTDYSYNLPMALFVQLFFKWTALVSACFDHFFQTKNIHGK